LRINEVQCIGFYKKIAETAKKKQKLIT